MNHEQQGAGFDPGARGHELQGRATRTLTDEEFVERCRIILKDGHLITKEASLRLIQIIDALRAAYVRKPNRCGSYPFRYIAEDFGVPYGVVLRSADRIVNGEVITGDDLSCIVDALTTIERMNELAARICQALKEVRP